MKKIIVLAFVLFFSMNLFSQQNDDYYNIVHDPKAREVLDKLSSKLAKDTSFRIYFNYYVFNLADSSEKEFNGWLYIKKDKYKLLMPDFEMFSDGKKEYSYNYKSNELNITYLDTISDNVLTPETFLDIYKKGYKYKYVGQNTFDAKFKKGNKIVLQKVNSHLIELYPEDIDNSPYTIIRLWIDKDRNQLLALMFQGKAGINEVITIYEFKENPYISDKLFEFDKNRYPKNVEIIDFTTNQ